MLGEPGDLTVGSEIEFVLSAAGFTHRDESVVTAFEPPRLITWRYVKGATGEGGWTVEEMANNGVWISLHTDYEVQPAWLNAIAHRPFFRSVTEDLLRRSMRRFAERMSKGR